MAEFRSTRVNSAPAVDTLSGTIGGRFLIGERLGKGGMGEVYRAEDTKLKRSVALKRLGPHLRSDAAYRLRFLEEAERASRLSDSHIAAVHDVLEERGEIFLVMEYVEGENLRERLHRHMSLEQFFELAVQCAEALVAAHERGIVHCDIKPENIMLTTTSQVKMLDFGLARHLPRSDQSSTVDRAGAMAGTPAYMSPEVLLEKSPDARADIFSLGVVFYEVLTGHHPFLASSFVATSDRIRRETPVPIHIFNTKVPEELEKLISKAMAKEPGQRHASARELLQNLRVVQAGVTPSKLWQVLPRTAERPPKRWLAAVTVVAVVAAAVFGIYRWRHRPPILTERGWVLISDFDTSGDETIPDKGVREGLTIALQQSRYVNVYPRTQVFEVLQRMKKENVQRIDEALGREICQRENLQVLLTGSIEHLGQVFQITVRALDPAHGRFLFAERERFDRKEQFFDKADGLAKRVRTDLGESLLGIEKTSRPLAKVTTPSLEALQLYSQAADAITRGDTEQVPILLQSALQLDSDFAMAHLRLGEYYSAIVGKNEKALAEMKRAYELRLRITDREQRWIEGNYFNMQERYEGAAQALSVLVSLYPDDAGAHEELASAYYNLAQLDRAIIELREVLRLNPLSLSAYGKLVVYLARNNADDDAIAAFREANQRRLDSPELHWGLGMAYFGQGKVDQARLEFRRLAGGGEAFGDLGQLYLSMVDLYEGRLAAAKTQIEARINADQASHSTGLQLFRRYLLGRIYLFLDEPNMAKRQADLIAAAPDADLQTNDLTSAGILYARAGDPTRARSVLRRLDAARKAIPSSWNKSSYRNLEAEIALAEGKSDQALESLQAAVAEYPQSLSHLDLARAYHSRSSWQPAAAEWEVVLQKRGEILHVGFPSDLVVAQLHLARAYRKLKLFPQARAHYEEFLHLWHAADDLPIRRQALLELQEMIHESANHKSEMQEVPIGGITTVVAGGENNEQHIDHYRGSCGRRRIPRELV
jgi:tetratricopeptide (TPR) repeat protein/predicted Ser/Thr protein kinase